MSRMRKVYVWQLPVRVYHWVNALCIVVLALTGFLIGKPIALQNAIEASFSYWFGIVRFTHFVFAFLFFFNFAFRTFWGFAGNEYCRWYHFIPLKRKQWKEIFAVLRIDILQSHGKPIDSVGHNSLAGFTYFLTFIVFMLQVLTGFALYADMSTSWFPQMFAWVSPMLGGDMPTRQLHHVLMWGFIIFALIHVYLVFYHDYVEKRGVTSSMIGGWKFIEDEEAHK
jgi:Ni/Fe-hydrogenase 1 B-type cytochrome subunit